MRIEPEMKWKSSEPRRQEKPIDGVILSNTIVRATKGHNSIWLGIRSHPEVWFDSNRIKIISKFLPHTRRRRTSILFRKEKEIFSIDVAGRFHWIFYCTSSLWLRRNCYRMPYWNYEPGEISSLSHFSVTYSLSLSPSLENQTRVFLCTHMRPQRQNGKMCMEAELIWFWIIK